MRIEKRAYFKIIGVGILLWLLYQIDLKIVYRSLLQSNYKLLILAVIFMLIHFCFKMIRYRAFLIKQGVVISFKTIVHISLASIYLSFITPGRVGDISKAYFLHKFSRASLNKLIATSILDRAYDVYLLIIVFLVGLSASNAFGQLKHTFILTVIVLSSIPLIFLIDSYRKKLFGLIEWIQIKLTKSSSWNRHVQVFFSEIDSLLSHTLCAGAMTTFAAYLFFFGSCYFISLSLDVELSYFQISFFIACANILSFLPISFAGIGTREVSLVYLFSIENLSSESALTFSTLVFSFTYLLFGIIGFFCFMTLDYSRQELIDNA
jgi:uncharacterized protein (TIRG00374 family)